MKKFALVIAILAIASVASAADVPIAYTIPSEYVELLTTATKAELMYPGATGVCAGMNPNNLAEVKACHIRWVKQESLKFVQDYWYDKVDLPAATSKVQKRAFDINTGN